MLFLGFSFFVIAAAVMLVMLLFRLGIEQRGKHVGLLLALGFRPRQVTWILAGEGLPVAVAGSLLGTLAGVGYAALMLFGLRTWWLPAIGTPFLTLYVSWQSPVIGLASGLLMALAAIWLAVRRICRIAPRRLLAGEAERRRRGEREGGEKGRRAVLSTQYSIPSAHRPFPSQSQSQISNRNPFITPSSFILLHPCSFSPLAPAAILLLVPLGEDAQVGAFFGAGSLVAGVAADARLLATPPRRDRAGGGPRARQPAPPGPPQCGPQPRPQRPGHRADGLGLFLDRGRERVSRRSGPAGRRRPAAAAASP